MSAEPQGRAPPSDMDAEGAVLSAMLLDSSSLDQIVFLEPRHFYADANRRVYEAALALRASGRPVDVVSVAGLLRDQQRLEQIGGSPYLAQLSDATPAIANIGDHAKTIVGKWEVRQVIIAAQSVLVEAYGNYGDLDEWKQSVDERISISTRSNDREERLVVLADATRETIKVIQDRSQRHGVILTGVTTGLPTLDARLGGLEAQKLYVLAARPSVGKTAAATNMALACAKNPDPKNPDGLGDGVVFVSVEMPRRQISFRVLSQISRLDSVKLQRGKLTPMEWKDLAAAQEKIGRLPVIIEDSSNHSPASIRVAFRMGKRKLQDRFGKDLKVKLCAIDYLQLLTSHSDNREQEISAISRSCKAMSKDEDIAVLALAQVNRDCEKRPDKRPMLSDLRESGAIEQDADSVIFIYRHDVYRPKDEEKDDNAEFIVAKLRDNGGPGVVHMKFDPKTTSFYETSRDPDYEQLGDMFDDFVPGTYGDGGSGLPAHTWHDDLDK